VALTITQAYLDKADLVVIVGHDGVVEYSHEDCRSKDDVADMLYGISKAIRKGEM
jgi:hypothetical protein